MKAYWLARISHYYCLLQYIRELLIKNFLSKAASLLSLKSNDISLICTQGQIEQVFYILGLYPYRKSIKPIGVTFQKSKKIIWK